MKNTIFNTINKSVIKLFFTMTLLVMNNIILFAQTDFDDDVVDTPAAPIDDYLWVLALVGLVLAFMWFRSIHNKKINNKIS